MKRLVIFDLDGTLLNTIKDLASSTNYALTKLGHPTHPTEDYRFFVGNGINKLFERALPEAFRNEKEVLQMRQVFVQHYNQHKTDQTTPYEGIPHLLHTLQQKGFLLAVASNKYQEGTEQLVRTYFGDVTFCTLLGQRSGHPTKPDPSIVLEIMQTAGIINPQEVLYVGDSGVDMQTAHNAGVDACGVTWGFRPRQELEQYLPEHLIDAPQELLKLL